MTGRFNVFLSGLIALLLLSCSRAADANPMLYVSHFSSDDITVIDAKTYEAIETFSVAESFRSSAISGDVSETRARVANIDDIVGSPDGNILYVNRVIESGHKLGWPVSGEIVAIDTKTKKALWSLEIDEGWPHHISLSSDGRYLYAPLFDKPYVIVIDTRNGTLERMIDLFWGGHGSRLSKDDESLYIGSIFTSSLYVVGAETGTIQKIIPFEDGVRPFAFDSAQKTLYAQLSRLHGFAVADLEAGKVKKTVELPGLPQDFEGPEFFPHNVNHGLELSPNEEFLVAAGTAVNKAFLYSHPELELLGEVNIGSDANWVTFSPDSSVVFISNRGDNTVSVITLDTFEEIVRLPSGGERPGRMRIVGDYSAQ
ncbi:MAG: YncE family protein [Pseudomonadota bacterium]